MRRTTWRSWLPLTFFALTVLFLILNEAGVLTPVESSLQSVIAPLQQAGSSLVEEVGGIFSGVRERRELEAQVSELQAQVDALTAVNIRLQEYEAGYRQLRWMLRFVDENPSWGFLGADVLGQDACLDAPCGEVIGVEPNPYIRYLTINLGAVDGLEVGMPVVARGHILIGRIARVGRTTSKVQLLNDADSRVAVRLQDSRATGLVAGQMDGSLLMIFIPLDEEIAPDDVALTSGLGGALPRGLVVGQVTDVARYEFASHQEAVIRPAIDYRQVELVLVITSFQPLVDLEPADPGTQP